MEFKIVLNYGAESPGIVQSLKFGINPTRNIRELDGDPNPI